MVSFQNDITFGINRVCEVDSVYNLAPFMEEVLLSILCNVNQHSSEVLLLEILIHAPVFKIVEHNLKSSFEDAVENLTNASRSVVDGFSLSLSHGLRSMMPVLERSGQVKFLASSKQLTYLPNELPFVAEIFFDGLKARSH